MRKISTSTRARQDDKKKKDLKMGKKAKWFVAVKKVFSPESKKKKKEARLKKKFEPGASVLVDPCPTETLEGTVCEVVPPPLPHTQEDKAVEAESEQRRHDSSLAVATATEPLMTSACASIEVNRLASATQFAGKMSEEIAAIKIQTAFRGHLARRALRALRGLVRLKSLVDGNSVQRQAITTLRCMQTLGRVQSQIRFQRIRILEENQALKRQMLLKHERELESLKMGEEWDDSLQSKEQLEASLLSKQEASIRRERAMAYAFSHQWKGSSKPVNPMFMDPNNVQWGWSWLERWMAGTSDKEPTSDAGGEILKDRPSPVVHKLNHPASRQVPSTPPVKAPWLTKKIKSASPKRGWPPLEDDSKSTATVQSERPRRHSFAAASTREDEGLASSLAVPSYMAPTESARAKSRFQSLSNDNIESSDKSPVASVKKRLSFPAGERYATSSAPSSAMRRSSGPPKVDVASVKDIEIQS